MFRNPIAWIPPLKSEDKVPPPDKPWVYAFHLVSGMAGKDYVPLVEANPNICWFGVSATNAMVDEFNNNPSLDFLTKTFGDEIMKRHKGNNSPIHLAGWSAGSFVALEVARYIQNQGVAVAAVISFDGVPPNLRENKFALVLRQFRNVPRTVQVEGLGKVAERARLKWRKLKSQKEVLGDNFIHPVKAHDWYNEVPENRRAFAESLHDLLFGDTRKPYDRKQKPYHGRVILYATDVEPVFIAPARAFWNRFVRNPRPEIVKILGDHASIIKDKNNAEILTNDLARRLAAKDSPTPPSLTPASTAMVLNN